MAPTSKPGRGLAGSAASKGSAGDPAPPGPMQERARRTRAAVLQAAAASFAERGYQGAPTSAIAAAAGVTKGALAFHFPTKADLAVAIVEDFYQRWPAVIDAIRARSTVTVEAIGEILRTVAVQVRDDMVVRAAVRLQSERADIDAELPPPYTAWIESLTGLYYQASGAGELRPGLDPRALARMTVSAFFGIQHVSGAVTGYGDVTDRVEEFWSVFRTGIAPAGTPGRHN